MGKEIACDQCYKIALDLSVIKDLELFINKVSSIGDIMLVDDAIYVWLDEGNNEKELRQTLKRNGVVEYFCKNVDRDHIDSDGVFNFFTSWFLEHYNNFIISEAEKQNQKLLREAYDNIERAKIALDNKKQEQTNASMTNNKKAQGV